MEDKNHIKLLEKKFMFRKGNSFSVTMRVLFLILNPTVIQLRLQRLKVESEQNPPKSFNTLEKSG